MNNQPPDLLVLFTALLAVFFSPTLSAVLAPYAVILLGALLGAAWGLRRRPAGSKVWGFVALMLGTALVFTMPTAVYLQGYFGAGTIQGLLAPLALVIAAVGEDWPRVGMWLVDVGRRVVIRRAGTDSGPSQQ